MLKEAFLYLRIYFMFDCEIDLMKSILNLEIYAMYAACPCIFILFVSCLFIVFLSFLFFFCVHCL